MVEKLYIHDPESKYNSAILSTANKTEDGRIIVHYTGKEHVDKKIEENGAMTTTISFTDPLTFEEYNKQHGGRLKLLTEDEVEKMLHERNEKMSWNFKEVDEERWWWMLECVPPKRWTKVGERLEVFFNGEPYSGPLHTLLIKDKDTGKYYECLASIYSTTGRMQYEFENFINK